MQQYRQKYCGLQEYGTQIEKFDLQPSAVKQYQKLWHIVAPDDRQKDSRDDKEP